MGLLYRIGTNAASSFDKRFNTKLKERGGRLYRYCLMILSPVRRILDPIFIKFFWRSWLYHHEDIKLHLGCGWKYFKGFINVDLKITDATNIICDISKLPWPDSSVSIIESYHVIEHISHRKIEDTLKEWHRVLKKRGQLVIECPNFDNAVKDYLCGNENRLLNIFGRQRTPGDAHLYGYNFERLFCLLKKIGFIDITEKRPQSSQTLDEPCMRVVCRK